MSRHVIDEMAKRIVQLQLQAEATAILTNILLDARTVICPVWRISSGPYEGQRGRMAAPDSYSGY